MRLAARIGWRSRDPCHRLLHATPVLVSPVRHFVKTTAHGETKPPLNQGTPLPPHPGDSDPSALFLHSGTSETPIMSQAKAFFEHINRSITISAAASPSSLLPFHIHLGKKTGWRCVAKLAVRHQPPGREEGRGEGEEGGGDYSLPAIGLFAPGTHRVVTTPSVAHHPAVEAALLTVRAACRRCGLVGYREGTAHGHDRGEDAKRKRKRKRKEDTKTSKRDMVLQQRREGAGVGGYLKYLLFNVDTDAAAAHVTGPAPAPGVQLTVVWDSCPPSGDELHCRSHSNSDSGPHPDTSSQPGPGLPATSSSGRMAHSEAVLTGFLRALRDQSTEESMSDSGSDGSSRSSIHSLWVHYNPTHSHSHRPRSENSIMSTAPGSWRLISGPGAVYESLLLPPLLPHPPLPGHSHSHNTTTASGGEAGARLVFPPFVFRQANSEAFRNIVHSIRHWIAIFSLTSSAAAAASGSASATASATAGSPVNGRKPRCIELYGGVGTIGLNCLDLVEELLCSDENPFNQACFEETLRSLPAQYREKATYMTSSAAGMLQPSPSPSFSSSASPGPFDVLIVDPPRKGLDKEVLHALCCPRARVRVGSSRRTGSQLTRLSAVKRLIYVSCGFKSFQRDASALLGLTEPAHTPLAATAAPVSSEHAAAGEDLHTPPPRRTAKAAAAAARTRSTSDAAAQQEHDLADAAAICSQHLRRTQEEQAQRRAAAAGAGGGWSLVHAEGHVLFPGSDHLETLAIFDRK